MPRFQRDPQVVMVLVAVAGFTMGTVRRGEFRRDAQACSWLRAQGCATDLWEINQHQMLFCISAAENNPIRKQFGETQEKGL